MGICRWDEIYESFKNGEIRCLIDCIQDQAILLEFTEFDIIRFESFNYPAV